jgi:hypothetical protein
VTTQRYLVEIYASARDQAEMQRTASRARAAARKLTAEGTPVRCIRSVFVPSDEVCFLLYEGPSADAVGEATRRAAIEVERVVEAVSIA